MASFRRSLSLGPQPGSSVNEEAYSIASPLSKSSSFNSDHPQIAGGLFPRSFGSLDYALNKIQTLFLGFFPKRSSRQLERLKSSKGNSWRKSLFYFMVFFLVGIFVGLTPFVSPTFSTNPLAIHHAISSEKLQQVDRIRSNYHVPRNGTSVVDKLMKNDNSTSKPENTNDHELKDETIFSGLSNQSIYQDTNMLYDKLLIIVTPTYARPLQAYYLNRLSNTLKLVHPPLLWIVVEMKSKSVETAELLRNSGVIYRHLTCEDNLSDEHDRGMRLRNLALSHIETHRLDGIIYFADDDNMYTIDLFDQMRKIRRFGVWTVAKLEETKRNVIVEGPICNGTQVIGWHKNDISIKFQRFHIGLSGFAFNSTILWDPKRWHRSTLEPIRVLGTIKRRFQVISMFIEQIVENESQMEGYPLDCSRIIVWNINMELLYSFPQGWSSLLPYWFNSMKIFP